MISDKLQPYSSAAPLAGEPRDFDARSAHAFICKFNPSETRKAYARAIQDFFDFTGWLHQSEVEPAHVLAYRERLVASGRKARTVSARLAALRSYFDYLTADGTLSRNPASTTLVSPPKLSRVPAGRALSKKEALNLLASPDRRTPAGARDYALLLVMLRLALRVSEVCALRTSSIRARGDAGWMLTCQVKGGREERWPLPADVKAAVDEYLRLDAARRSAVRSDAGDAWLFQPVTNYRTLEFDRSLSQRQVEKLVGKWADYAGLGKLTPHDLRRTCLTEMLKVHPAHKVQMVSKHRDLNTLMGYNHDRENLDENPVNTFTYE